MSVEKRGKKYRVRWREGSRNRSRSFDRKRDAVAFDAEQRRTRQLGGFIAPLDGGMELEDLCAEWLALRKADLAPSTWEDYAYLIEKHLSSFLGHVPVGQLSPRRVSDWQTDRLSAGAGRTSIAKTGMLLKAILEHAERLELVPRNAARVLRRPKSGSTRCAVIPTPTQIEAMRAHLLAGERVGDATLVSLLAYGGLRPGEALAARWADLGSKVLHVYGSKTDTHRRVTLESFVSADLAQWRLLSTAEGFIFPRARDGERWTDHDYRNWRRREFSRAAAAAGLLTWNPDKGTAGGYEGGFTPYDLRHFRASYLIACGWDVTEVARELGHSPEMCLRTYAHVFEDRPEGDPAEWIREARAA